jgi:hypothetical protein
MMGDANEKELTTFGFTKNLRAGLITALFSVLLTSVAFLYREISKAKDRELENQKVLYEKMIDYIDPAKKKLEEAAKKADTVLVQAQASIVTTDSLNNIKSQNIRK